MSDPGRTEDGGGKPPKPYKKKKDEEGTSKNLPKAVIGKLNIPKKIKKMKEAGAADASPPSGKEGRLQKSKLSEEKSTGFIRSEGTIHTSTPVKPPKPSEKSENSKLVEGRKTQPPSPKPELDPLNQDAPHKSQDAPHESQVIAHKSQDVPQKGQDIPHKNPTAKSKFHDAVENFTDDSKDDDGSESSKSSSMETAFSSAEPEAQSGHKKECLYKILVIGELGTGKTSIIKRYVHQFFSQHYRATIGVDFALKVLNWDQSTIIRLQLWDIAGQERFGNMTRVYYKEAVGAFIVFDVTRAATFDAVVKWKQDLDAKVQLADGSPIPCVLLANKCDQQKEGIVNNPNKMNEYCEEHKFTAWFETSAKENINIEEAAKTLVDQIVRNDSTNENGRNGTRDLSKFPLESSEDFPERKNPCNC